MQTNKTSRAVPWLTYTVGLLAVALIAAACETTTPLGPMRVTAGAPDLEYLPPEQVRTTMWVLAAEVQQLERLLSDPTAKEKASLQPAVRGTLERMRIAAKTLDEPGRTTQHPVINRNLKRFVGRIERARRAVDRVPPNYFAASTIAGSCFVCHGEMVGVASSKIAPKNEGE